MLHKPDDSLTRHHAIIRKSIRMGKILMKAALHDIVYTEESEQMY